MQGLVGRLLLPVETHRPSQCLTFSPRSCGLEHAGDEGFSGRGVAIPQRSPVGHPVSLSGLLFLIWGVRASQPVHREASTVRWTQSPCWTERSHQTSATHLQGGSAHLLDKPRSPYQAQP